jgi:ribonucleoside-triphosphate reductase (thioredoxin)
MEGYIEEFEVIENEDVFDLTVEDTHCFFGNGILVHNCAEQSLENNETCCLAETYLPNISSYDELVDVIKLLYRICKHSLTLPCHLEETQEVVHRNMRMGIGMTGVLQASEEQRSWLKSAYEELRRYDTEYSAANGFPTSIKLTTIKPSGSLSLIPGVTPGIHPGYAQYMIRRIRIMSNHPLVQICRDHGYPVEFQENFDGTFDRGTVVVSFPFSYPEGTVLAEQMTALDQLAAVKNMQEVWSDNAVSCTIYYRKEELPEIKKYLAKNYKNSHKSLSFLLHSDHGFKQAPYEAISKEQFDDLVSKTRLITSIQTAEFDGVDECANGSCPIR